MDLNFVSLQEPDWPIPEQRTSEIFEYQEMYWYDWQSPGYLLMTSCISVSSSKLSHSHLTVQDSTALNNNSTEIRGEKNLSSVHKNTVQSLYGNTTWHNEYGTEQNITEQNKDEDIRHLDRPLLTKHTHENLDHFASSFFDFETWCYNIQNTYVGIRFIYVLYRIDRGFNTPKI